LYGAPVPPLITVLASVGWPIAIVVFVSVGGFGVAVTWAVAILPIINMMIRIPDNSANLPAFAIKSFILY
jgi:putative flippase GtrA